MNLSSFREEWTLTEYRVENDDIVAKIADFDLDETLDCGQAFRWEKLSDNCYRGEAYNTPLTIADEGEGLFRFKNTTEPQFLSVWRNYFDLDSDYGDIKSRISADETMRKACEYAGGIRLLRQDAWEALCSFIISQNNNIPRIKGIIHRLCEHFGGFPTAEALSSCTPDDLAFLRAGFRAKYIVDAAKKVAAGEVSLDRVRNAPIEDARKELMTIIGVGPKVAECALLYGMYRVEAFPVDVWIKRVMAKYYPSGLPECCIGIQGIAQQYLFHYMRTAVQD